MLSYLNESSMFKYTVKQVGYIGVFVPQDMLRKGSSSKLKRRCFTAMLGKLLACPTHTCEGMLHCVQHDKHDGEGMLHFVQHDNYDKEGMLHFDQHDNYNKGEMLHSIRHDRHDKESMLHFVQHDRHSGEMYSGVKGDYK